ncbi:AlpA family phage regulatory protein [Vibrio fluvialis]|nr:AlpA family phage regulatory protein [Vibrio fluvialis]
MNTNISLIRLSEVLKLIPLSKATVYRRINDGSFPPPISLGPNSSAFYEHEVKLILAAMPLGKDLKSLVSALIEQRETLFEYLNTPLAA